eukprot:scaffold202871_cov31-Prasinocladus_malaysianus.AAC.1
MGVAHLALICRVVIANTLQPMLCVVHMITALCSSIETMPFKPCLSFAHPFVNRSPVIGRIVDMTDVPVAIVR